MISQAVIFTNFFANMTACLILQITKKREFNSRFYFYLWIIKSLSPLQLRFQR